LNDRWARWMRSMRGTQRTLGNGLTAAAALRAPGRGRFNHRRPISTVYEAMAVASPNAVTCRSIPSGVRRARFAHVIGAALLATGISDVSSAKEQVSAGTIEVTGGRIHLTIADADLTPARDRLRAWTARSADVVARYYGRFPMLDVQVVLESQPAPASAMASRFARMEASSTSPSGQR
jgi:hypothetical protein